ncbi:MAG: DUF4430 domain-containing protein [Lachnospira eligens]
MFNKYRNIKKIGLVLIGLAVVIFLITNVRIRSVDSYRKQFSNMAGSSQTQPDRPDNNDRLQDETISTDNANAADNGSFYETGDGAGNGAVSDDNFATESTDNIAATDNNSGSGGNESDRSNGTAISGDDDSGSSNSGNGNSGNNSQNTRPAGRIISCTIEIRCDNATARKDSITNQGIRDSIPDDGTILEVTTYTGKEGFTVYDVLAAVTAAHNPVIPIVANSDKSYVSSINNLSEKNVGPQSGWTYRVNGVLPMMAANQYTVKDGDVIKWIYVCQLGDK